MISPAALADLVPTGRLRVGILHTSPVLAAKDPASGKLSGIAVDLAWELGKRIGMPLDIIGYETTARLLDDLHARSAWDIGFFSHDPDHPGVSFTAPYLECEGTYLVMAGSPLRAIADIDRDGIRVAVSAKSSLDLHLSRNLKYARLERIPGATAAAELFMAGKTHALAGIRQQLIRVARKLPGSRVLDSRFVVIRHAIASPASRDAGARYLRTFVEDTKTSGLIAQLIRKNGIQGALVAHAQPIG